MAGNTVPTPITDRNGKQTTVHKKVDAGVVSNDRSKDIGAPKQAVEEKDVHTEKLDAGIYMLDRHRLDVDNAVAAINEHREKGYVLEYSKITALAKASAQERPIHQVGLIIENMRAKGEHTDEEILEAVSERLQKNVEAYSGARSTSVISNEMEHYAHEITIQMLGYFRKGAASYGF